MALLEIDRHILLKIAEHRAKRRHLVLKIMAIWREIEECEMAETALIDHMVNCIPKVDTGKGTEGGVSEQSKGSG